MAMRRLRRLPPPTEMTMPQSKRAIPPTLPRRKEPRWRRLSISWLITLPFCIRIRPLPPRNGRSRRSLRRLPRELTIRPPRSSLRGTCSRNKYEATLRHPAGAGLDGRHFICPSPRFRHHHQAAGQQIRDANNAQQGIAPPSAPPPSAAMPPAPAVPQGPNAEQMQLIDRLGTDL